VAACRVDKFVRHDAGQSTLEACAALHHSFAQQLVLSGKQILHEIVTASIRVARGAGEMMIDSHSRRAAEIIRNGKNFIGWLPLTEQPLRVRTGRADRKQFRGDSDKSGKKQLLTIEFWTEAAIA